MFEIKYTVPGQVPRRLVLDQPRMIIGTLLSNHVVLRAPSVDPIHAMLEEVDGKWIITDLSSENGVKVNNQQIDVETPLKVGDIIHVGSAVLEFLVPAEQTPRHVFAPTEELRVKTPAAEQFQKEPFREKLPETAVAGETPVAKEGAAAAKAAYEGREKRAKKPILFSPRDARPAGDVLEAVAYWGDTVLDVDLFSPDERDRAHVTIGNPTVANFIAAGPDNVSRHPLASFRGGGYRLRLLPGMQARIRKSGKVESIQGPKSLNLDRKDLAHIKYGAVKYFLLFVRPPHLILPKMKPADPFIVWLSFFAMLIYLAAIPALWLTMPKQKKDDSGIYEIVYSPEQMKKPEPEKKPKEPPKPTVKVEDKKVPTPPPKAPPPPKPKPVQPAKPVEKEKVDQPKPVMNPVEKANPNKPITENKTTPNDSKLTERVPPRPVQPQDDKKKLAGLSKATAGMPSADAKKPDFKYAGPQNNKPLGAAGGPKGSGNNQIGGEIKGNQAASVMGVEGVNNNKPSGVNLSKLGVGVGKVLSKTSDSAIYTNFQNSSGGAGGGMGSGAKTYGLGGSGSGKSLGLAGASGSINNFGSGSGGFLGGQGGSGGLGGSGGGPGFGNGGKGDGRGGHGRADVAIPPGDPAVSGGLTAQEIQVVIKANLNEIRHCYEQLLQRSPNSSGKITVNFVVGLNGSVNSVSVVESSISDSVMRGCVTGRINTWRFPQPRGGQPVTVKYPFVFNPL